jgi:hypothetical protein
MAKLFNVTHLTTEKLVSLIMSDQTILAAIREAAHETPDQPWTVIDIHELVMDSLEIDLDLDDTALFGQLLLRFNAEQMIALTVISAAS